MHGALNQTAAAVECVDFALAALSAVQIHDLLPAKSASKVMSVAVEALFDLVNDVTPTGAATDESVLEVIRGRCSDWILSSLAVNHSGTPRSQGAAFDAALGQERDVCFPLPNLAFLCTRFDLFNTDRTGGSTMREAFAAALRTTLVIDNDHFSPTERDASPATPRSLPPLGWGGAFLLFQAHDWLSDAVGTHPQLCGALKLFASTNPRNSQPFVQWVGGDLERRAELLRWLKYDTAQVLPSLYRASEDEGAFSRSLTSSLQKLAKHSLGCEPKKNAPKPSKS